MIINEYEHRFLVCVASKVQWMRTVPTGKYSIDSEIRMDTNLPFHPAKSHTDEGEE